MNESVNDVKRAGAINVDIKNGSDDYLKSVAEGNGKSFEENITRLEALARQLERGDLSLEESLERYKEGVALIGYCQRGLERAAKEIEILMDGLNHERETTGQDK